MPHFLIKNEEISNNFIELSDSDNFFHLTRVLRVKTGEIVKFIDENGTVSESRITEITKKSLKAEIIRNFKSLRTLKNDIVLIQSVLSNDAQNLLIANAVQTGVKKIYPVISDNVSVSLNSLENKTEKWQKIAYENFKQCERADMPSIEGILSLKQAINEFRKENLLIFAERDENCNLNNCLEDIVKNEPVAVVIGPEGGFSEAEFEFFKTEGFKLITLGKMIYKAPNAVVAGISNIVSRLEV